MNSLFYSWLSRNNMLIFGTALSFINHNSLEYVWKEIFLDGNRHTLETQDSLWLFKGDYFWLFFSQTFLSLRHPFCVFSSWKNYHVFEMCLFRLLGFQDWNLIKHIAVKRRQLIHEIWVQRVKEAGIQDMPWY